ncbi:MAG: hypothetical protein RLZZ267_69 [Bacillota bacterium]|jgi:hypothetical protein
MIKIVVDLAVIFVCGGKSVKIVVDLAVILRSLLRLAYTYTMLTLYVRSQSSIWYK